MLSTIILKKNHFTATIVDNLIFNGFHELSSQKNKTGTSKSHNQLPSVIISPSFVFHSVLYKFHKPNRMIK